MYTHHNVHYEFEKGEIAKSRTLGENIWYEWNAWLNGHVPRCVKNFTSNVKEKIMKITTYPTATI